MTVTIQVGNSDNKLSQQTWSEFVTELREEIAAAAKTTHFFGGSATYEKWQNVCWVIEISEATLPILQAEITQIRLRFHQDAVAITSGHTEFL